MRTAPLRITKVVHAILGASSSKRWSSCTASPSHSFGKSNTTNPAARWGTACHLLSDTCLKDKTEPSIYLGWVVGFPKGDLAEVLFDPMFDSGDFEFEVPIDDEQIECATTFVMFCRDLRNSVDAEFMYSEVSVPIDHITKEEGATGYLDLIIGGVRRSPTHNELIVVDLKGGTGVKVDACDTITAYDPVFCVDYSTPQINTQIAMYLSGALRKYDPTGTIYTHVRGIIVQPRLNHISEYVCTVAELNETIQFLRERADDTRDNPVFAPSYEACMFCRAKDDCGARDRSVIRDVTGGFEDLSAGLSDTPLPSLGVIYEHIPMIEDWCNGKRRMVMNELQAGRQVIGAKGSYKLIPGQQGDRKWHNETSVEFILNSSIGEKAFTKKLIGPAGVEKLTKGKWPAVTKALWAELNKYITRADPSQPRIALSTDPAPAVASALDGFEDSQPTAEVGFT